MRFHILAQQRKFVRLLLRFPSSGTHFFTKKSPYCDFQFLGFSFLIGHWFFAFPIWITVVAVYPLKKGLIVNTYSWKRAFFFWVFVHSVSGPFSSLLIGRKQLEKLDHLAEHKWPKQDHHYQPLALLFFSFVIQLCIIPYNFVTCKRKSQ